MIRAVLALRAAAWWASVAAVLLWWAPSLALAAGALLAGRLRFRAALSLGRALVAVGHVGAARRVYAHEHRRAELRIRTMRTIMRRSV